MSSQSAYKLGHARRSFFESGADTTGRIRGTILESWRRCHGAGMSADSVPEIRMASLADLKQRRESHETLWRQARGELEGLSADVAEAGCIVLLTDESGWILGAEGSAGFLDKAGRVALMPGACWSEDQVGTNAIGTAIVEHRAVEVRGEEHYLTPHRILGCAASPIFDPYGRLVGVLDISGDARMQQIHALGLVRRAVASIEHRHFDAGIPDSELLRVHHDPALLGTAHEGLLAFRDGRLVAANRVGLALFSLERRDIGRARYDALIDEPLAHLRRHGVLSDHQGRLLHGSVDGRADERAAGLRSVSRGVVSRSARSAPVAQGTSGDELPFEAELEAHLVAARRVLDAGLPVLVQGETGTGKEVFARQVHRFGARAGGPFVSVNCAALPEGLIEAELFGYEEGAFTGARKQGSPGLLRRADGGVLFLDEIGDMPLALQPRLLRVLQDRELSPLGGSRPVKLDFALICATHQDLEAAMASGRFRADLYYRIAHHVVRMPALRDHADRRQLVLALWKRLGQGRRLTDAALDALAAYDWPGNLRQLNACLRILIALGEPDTDVDVDALPGYVRPRASDTGAPKAVPGTLDGLAESAMRRALQDCGGNVTRAARRLGVSRSTLYRRLQLKRD